MSRNLTRISSAIRLAVMAFVLAAGLGSAASHAGASRLGEIRARGALHCGIWPHVPGFASEHDGAYSGFDVDMCRAVAAALFGDAGKVRFVELANIAQFRQRTDVDLVVRRLTWTPRRESRTGMVFGPVTFYDGQGFLVPRDRGIGDSMQLAGRRVCVMSAERHPATLRRFSDEHNLRMQLVPVETDAQAEAALRQQRCDAYSADLSWLAAARSSFSDGLARYALLSELISKEPLAPMMRAEDTELLQLVRWTIYALIEAEELGIDSRNVAALPQAAPRLREWLNLHPGVNVALDAGDWARALIAGVGNYGELYERNLGALSTIKLDRGINRLWSAGGLLFAPPLEQQ